MNLRAFLAVLIIIPLAGVPAFSADDREDDIPLPVLLAPGGTHLYQGDKKEGLAFLGAELSLIAGGMSVNDRLDKDHKNEFNLPYLLSAQIYVVDKFSYYQKEMIKIGANPAGGDGAGYDPTPLPDLLLAPFKSENIFSPFVLAFAALGAIDGIVAYPKNRRRLGDVKEVNALGHKMNRDTGTLYYETASAAVSWGAATSEEALFRGMIMPILDHKFGKRAGLTASSITFGVLHLGNPDIDDPGYYLAQATIVGFLLGWKVQEDGYRLGKAIAAHFWYDMMSTTATWLENPRENPLGIGVVFQF